MKYKRIEHDCPWHATNRNACCNKNRSYNRKYKPSCIYKDASKCPIYQEWADYARIREDALKELKTSEKPIDREGCE